MNYKLNMSAGYDFSTFLEKAKEIATDKNVVVEFEFNDIVCQVNKKTNLDWLYRDYCNSWIMGWKVVGPECVKKYDKETKNEFQKRTAIAEEKLAKESEQRKIKNAADRAIFKEKTANVEMEFTLKEDWEQEKSKNTDEYGACIFEYAEGWAKLMQVEILNGKQLKDIAEKTSHEIGFLGISGFMYGVAVSVLAQYWKYGEELKLWHNKKYNHEGYGVINPAILTISV